VLFKSQLYPRLADGSITLAFRRWRRPQVRAGTAMRTPAGMLQVDAIEVIDPETITDEEARRAGATDRLEVLQFLDGRAEGEVYRIAFHHAGADPREALREHDDLSEDETAAILARLARLDRASSRGPWTHAILRVIEAHPAVRAGDLAADLGRDKDSFKLDVRKLKNLGLTESLGTGYRISPRGRVVLRALDAR
jgi:hypothetical protein